MKRRFYLISIIITIMSAGLTGCSDPSFPLPDTIYTIYYYSDYGSVPENETVEVYTDSYTNSWDWIDLKNYYKEITFEGKVFKGWYFYKDNIKYYMDKNTYGDVQIYYLKDGNKIASSCNIKSNIALYAIWADTVKVTLKNESQTIKTLQFEQYVGTHLPTVSELGIEKIGYGFKGWALSASAKEIKYTDADSITPQADISLYAIWAKGIGATPSTIEDTILGLTGEATIILTGKYPYNADNTIANALKKIEVPVTLDFSGTKGFTYYYFSFKDCTSLKGIVIPQTLTQIYDSTFSGCTALENVTIPSSITKIGSYAFTNCKSLKKIELPSSVTKIDNLAFSNCTSLSSITIPESVQWIWGGAFNGCLSLSEIIFEDTSTWYQTSNSSNWTNRTGGSTVLLTDSTGNVTILNSTWSSDYYYYFYKL